MALNYKMPRKTFVFLVVFAALLIVVCTMILHTDEVKQRNATILFTFSINLLLCFVMLLKAVKRHSYSFDMMFWLFGLFFFGIAPILQYVSKTYAWTMVPKMAEIQRTNIYILLWLCCYLIGWSWNVNFKISRDQINAGGDRHYKYQINSKALNSLLIISMLITVYFIISVGFTNLFTRATNVNEGLEGPMALIVQHGFRNIVLFTLVLSILHARSRGKIGYEPIVAAVCCIISNAPTGLARNMMASFYGGLLIILLANASKKRWITFAIIGGLVVVFPAINVFRRMPNGSSEKVIEMIVESIQDTYLTGDYDAHQMFISIQRWVEKDGFQNGWQLLGALLFFVPRSVWPSKPLGTGRSAFVATKQHWFKNVSAPLVSEAWVNFGVVGIIVFGILLGYVTKYVDNRYWLNKDECGMIRVIYPSLMLMFFFVQRGDLLATGSYLVAQLFIGILVHKFVVKKTEL